MAASTNRIARRVVSPAAGWAVCGLLCVVAGSCPGCGGDKVTPIRNEAEFQKVVIQADRPVLVDFYKGGCPTCARLDPTMDQLAEEYRGRALVAKFKLMQPYGVVTSQELQDTYDIQYFPMVIVFVNGRPKYRFLRDYDLGAYRKALDEALTVSTTQRTPPATSPAGKPSGE